MAKQKPGPRERRGLMPEPNGLAYARMARRRGEKFEPGGPITMQEVERGLTAAIEAADRARMN